MKFVVRQERSGFVEMVRANEPGWIYTFAWGFADCKEAKAIQKIYNENYEGFGKCHPDEEWIGLESERREKLHSTTH
jgi:hypothetical protein